MNPSMQKPAPSSEGAASTADMTAAQTAATRRTESSLGCDSHVKPGVERSDTCQTWTADQK
jgi:hypothetical protein